MMKKILPVAVAALTLVLSAGGAFAEPPKPAGPSNASGIDYDQLQRLPDADMATVTGGACTEDVQALGRVVVAFGLIGLSHLMVATGQATISLAAFVCA